MNIRRLTLVTNPDKCNLRCPLCFLKQRGKPFGMGEMPLSLALESIEKYNACGSLREVVPSTMGEPLLYTYFSELLEYCRNCGLPLNLTTNGTFPGVWGTDDGMRNLLQACSDIKVSCMGFDETSMAEMMPGTTLDRWKGNVCRLLDLRQSVDDAATVSLQVTLHSKMVGQAESLLRWAERVGIFRIKWNLPVFLKSGADLGLHYGISLGQVAELREMLHSPKVRCEGSLFFGSSVKSGTLDVSSDLDNTGCKFTENEIWIMPDGSVEKCPNPEKRYGDREDLTAKCGKCLLWRPLAQIL